MELLGLGFGCYGGTVFEKVNEGFCYVMRNQFLVNEHVVYIVVSALLVWEGW